VWKLNVMLLVSLETSVSSGYLMLCKLQGKIVHSLKETVVSQKSHSATEKFLCLNHINEYDGN
jgi:hypothetical protein